MQEPIDYLIIGAGSAGCVLAERLSKDPRNRVCLLEAGAGDASFLINNPIGVIELMKSKTYNWLFHSVSQSNMHQREIFCPRGKVLGGSSAINTMIYTRGQPQDYDDWAAQGNTGWSYSEVLPYFRALQHQSRGEDEYHGTAGPLWVGESNSPLHVNQLFVQACEQVGLVKNNDFNAKVQEGVGPYQFTMKDGKRCSAAHAFLHPSMARSNLRLETHFKVSKILFDGTTAIGVEGYQKGKYCKLLVNKEVILSAGAFQSPHLLMLSGIGPAQTLSKHKIELKHELAGVGENLQEHVDIVNVIKINKPWSVALRPLFMLKMLPQLLQYWRNKTGFFASSVVEMGGFIRSSDSHDRPNLQLHFSPVAHDDHARNLGFMTQYGLSLHSCLLRPKSRGSVSLYSADYRDPPAIDLNVLDHQDDMQQMIEAVRLNRKILSQSVFADITHSEIFPQPEQVSDADIAEFIREKANHVYHPVGTCKMGSDDMAVVDARLRVHGLQNIRVADASIMPSIISGNTSAPCMMIGAKAADMILEDNA